MHLRTPSIAHGVQALTWAVVFFLFMWLNAAVVFVRGPMRWVGVAVCAAVVVARCGLRLRR